MLAENKSDHSSEDVEVDLGFLHEDMDREVEAIETMFEQKQLTQKQRLENILQFKSRLLDFVNLTIDKSDDPSKLITKVPNLLIYGFFTPDNSSSSLSNKIMGILTKYFNKYSNNLASPEFFAGNQDALVNTIDILFNLMMKVKKINKNSNLITSFLRKITQSDQELIQQNVSRNFEKLVDHSFQKKDTQYFECYVKSLINHNAKLFDDNHAKIVQFIKLEQDGGPKSDQHRFKGLCFIINYLLRITKSESDQKRLKFFLKENSKTIKNTLVSVVSSDEPFKKKPIKMYQKYLELAITVLQLQKQSGMKKRFDSLKEALVTVLDSLPKDNNLKKQALRITEIKME